MNNLDQSKKLNNFSKRKRNQLRDSNESDGMVRLGRPLKCRERESANAKFLV